VGGEGGGEWWALALPPTAAADCRLRMCTTERPTPLPPARTTSEEAVSPHVKRAALPNMQSVPNCRGRRGQCEGTAARAELRGRAQQGGLTAPSLRTRCALTIHALHTHCTRIHGALTCGCAGLWCGLQAYCPALGRPPSSACPFPSSSLNSPLPPARNESLRVPQHAVSVA
jgi:hypothetical protein